VCAVRVRHRWAYTHTRTRTHARTHAHTHTHTHTQTLKIGGRGLRTLRRRCPARPRPAADSPRRRRIGATISERRIPREQLSGTKLASLRTRLVLNLPASLTLNLPAFLQPLEFRTIESAGDASGSLLAAISETDVSGSESTGGQTVNKATHLERSPREKTPLHGRSLPLLPRDRTDSLPCCSA
jgi:hypothetical protein